MKADGTEGSFIACRSYDKSAALIACWAYCMRCFFMKAGRICAVEYLQGKSDDELIAEARGLFQTKGSAEGAEGFEVWDHTRFIYRYIAEGTPEGQPADGLKGPANWLERLFRRLPDKFSLPAPVPAPIAQAV